MKEVTQITTIQITNIIRVPDEKAEDYENFATNKELQDKVHNCTKFSVFPNADDVVINDQIFIMDVKED
ncbi:MAG: hypothetical protein J5617_03735 [Bacilli bacterium]|nr:hypothetical protein [Bacilli bacterium]